MEKLLLTLYCVFCGLLADTGWDVLSRKAFIDIVVNETWVVYGAQPCPTGFLLASTYSAEVVVPGSSFVELAVAGAGVASEALGVLLLLAVEATFM